MAKVKEEIEKEDEEHDDLETPRKGKRVILIVLILLVMLGGAGAGIYFSGMLSKDKDEPQEEAAAAEAPAEGEHGEHGGAKAAAKGPVFYEMPEFLINLNTGGGGTSFLKMKVRLELPSEEMVKKVQIIEPRIVDSLNTYLRELRASDLSGSAGLYHLREEILMRVNKTLSPDQVNDVLFAEIIVQ